jgi:hypothetical protein
MAAQLRNYHRDEKLPNLPAKLVTALEEAKEEVKARAATTIQANVANGYLALRACKKRNEWTWTCRTRHLLQQPQRLVLQQPRRQVLQQPPTAKAATTDATATPTLPAREEPSQMTAVQEQELLEYEEEDTL